MKWVTFEYYDIVIYRLLDLSFVNWHINGTHWFFPEEVVEDNAHIVYQWKTCHLGLHDLLEHIPTVLTCLVLSGHYIYFMILIHFKMLLQVSDGEQNSQNRHPRGVLVGSVSYYGEKG